VYRVARADRAGRLRFATLQGETARRTLPPALIEQVASAAWLDARGLALGSEALLRAWAALPWPWRAWAALRLVPRPVRDAAYRWVAAHRAWLRLGPLEWHGALTPEQQARFLP
jgi:predicted DCC family thiol-disulfide oxidoreductase YuxK